MRVLVIMPTYNERAALPLTLRALREDCPTAEVLIVDDNSPDGTGEWARAYAEQDRSGHVLHREGKEGLGRAYVAGFEWARDRGSVRTMEMAADPSHRPLGRPR